MAPSSASTICSDESSESARGSATHTLPGRRAASKTLSVVCVACSPEKPTSMSCKSTISSSSSIATTTPPENASASKHPMRYSFKEVLHFKREFTLDFARDDSCGGCDYAGKMNRRAPLLLRRCRAELSLPFGLQRRAWNFRATQEDFIDPSGIRNALQRIRVQHDEIGASALRDQARVEVRDPRGIGRGGDNRLGGR